ncbi:MULTISPECIES: excinuclease ABC subunit UvrB [unclassified Dehalobacter]|uniref:excinuclease ABC subunit UvrB n=1 Tax=unclassified Dehalobacter TaxID=2635733 RepID=UPI000E6C6C62|nr:MULTISPECIES: excinuclease ABC subunit UvrB [unclassified Dehalobacter]RJE47472.1 excinuclease ABC subunit B [Dehalobacter sp. MCB1]TCX48716.1 excinuclease ABC subunit B [Dehalobacter sp. 14DCB1]TCX56236.1 excinuclease ABC subunit B [Dehalobacter sp. 12DCB1]
MEFQLRAPYSLSGDQPQAVDKLAEGVLAGKKHQTLLGVTGSGKTFTMASIIERVQKPTLVLAHNKTLAGQLYCEFKEFFPENAVEYFVSYYDYYQPEAYVPSNDLYIEKDASINEEIEKLRHSATAALFERRDVIVVASVSCIYGMGSPDEYRDMVLSLRQGQEIERNQMLRKLVEIQYDRNDTAFYRGTFRVRGDVVEVCPASTDEKAVRIEMFGDEIEHLYEVNLLTGEILGERKHISIFPNSHYVTERDKLMLAAENIEQELEERLAYFRSREKLLEAQRIEQRTRYDIEMLREMGYCNGIENYSRHLTFRKPGETPYTLLHFFSNDFLMFIDESHQTLPQVRGMYEGDRSRKSTLVEHGFRLPSAIDNRPLRFPEFEMVVPQRVYVSATPGPYEMEHCREVVEQIIRPTGLIDPEIIVKPTQGQIDDLIGEIRQRIVRDERILVTTLTKRMAEDLTDYLKQLNINVRYLHSDIQTLERLEILRELRLGEIDVIIGINLLREGLDLPEVSLVAILDADKEGFLRSERSLIQTVGRAARNVNGKVIMYADNMTESMKAAIGETNRRRAIQEEYNRTHGIIPQTIHKQIYEVPEATKVAEKKTAYGEKGVKLTPEEQEKTIQVLEEEMLKAARELDFERAADLRDAIIELKGEYAGMTRSSHSKSGKNYPSEKQNRSRKKRG